MVLHHLWQRSLQAFPQPQEKPQQASLEKPSAVLGSALLPSPGAMGTEEAAQLWVMASSLDRRVLGAGTQQSCPHTEEGILICTSVRPALLP